MLHSHGSEWGTGADEAACGAEKVGLDDGTLDVPVNLWRVNEEEGGE